ncbi:MAG: hypothetical protein ACOH2F_03555 [Cellulomonas sp.]
MAADDWRVLLDDAEVRVVVDQVYRGFGAARFGRYPREYDELEPFLWDKAVTIAQWYTGPEHAWFATLHTVLRQEVAHYHGAVKRDAHNKMAQSIDAAADDYRASGYVGMLADRHLTVGDPLAIVLRRERLERVLLKLAARTTTQRAPSDGTCSEPLCPRLAAQRGLCSSHYRTWYQLWQVVDVCTVNGCSDLQDAAGLCSRHYLASRETNVAVARCAEPECAKAGLRRGLCQAHYDRARKHGGTLPALVRAPRVEGSTCAEPECARPVKSKALCSMHYDRKRNAH